MGIKIETFRSLLEDYSDHSRTDPRTGKTYYHRPFKENKTILNDIIEIANDIADFESHDAFLHDEKRGMFGTSWHYLSGIEATREDTRVTLSEDRSPSMIALRKGEALTRPGVCSSAESS